MRRCTAGLRPQTGVLILKENQAKKGFILDLDDQSVTRTDAQFRALFEKAGLELIATEVQKKSAAIAHTHIHTHLTVAQGGLIAKHCCSEVRSLCLPLADGMVGC